MIMVMIMIQTINNYDWKDQQGEDYVNPTREHSLD